MRLFVRVITVRTFMQEAALPCSLAGRSGGPLSGARRHQVMTVVDDPAGVEERKDN